MYDEEEQVNVCLHGGDHRDMSHSRCELCDHNPAWIRWLYVIAITVWTLLIIYIGIDCNSWLEWLVILVPYILFLIALTTAGKLSPYAEKWAYRSNTVGNLMIVIFPILVWAAARVDRTQHFLLIVVLATGIAIISMVDFWVPERWLGIVKHFRSITQTMSVALTILALISYYHDQKEGLADDDDSKRKKKKSTAMNDDDIIPFVH